MTKQIKPDDIVALRARRGWAQWELAEYLGVRQPTVCRLEAGQKIPGPIHKLLEGLMEAPASE